MDGAIGTHRVGRYTKTRITQLKHLKAAFRYPIQEFYPTILLFSKDEDTKLKQGVLHLIVKARLYVFVKYQTTLSVLFLILFFEARLNLIFVPLYGLLCLHNCNNYFLTFMNINTSKMIFNGTLFIQLCYLESIKADSLCTLPTPMFILLY